MAAATVQSIFLLDSTATAGGDKFNTVVMLYMAGPRRGYLYTRSNALAVQHTKFEQLCPGIHVNEFRYKDVRDGHYK